MSTDEPPETPGPTESAPTHSMPGVPDVEDPRSETPLTEEFSTGTANDPDVGSVGPDMTTITVDGEPVAVPPGSTLIDAIEAVDNDEYVPAVCYYDRDTEQADQIGPRSECRTCMVDTDEHGLVPSCSFPAEDGLSVSTSSTDAKEARDVNLDLLLSGHNLRCTTCGQNGRCELQDASIENDVNKPRYGVFDEREEYEPLDDSTVIQIDRNKCILCNRCVEACNDVQNAGVLRMEGGGGSGQAQGSEMRIGFQKPEAEKFSESTCITCGHCVTVCPTGSLVEDGLVDATTIPLPGFTQKNSIGKTLGETTVETADTAEAPNREVPSDQTGQTATEDAEKSGVAKFMQKAKRQASNAPKKALDGALKQVEHATEKGAEESLTIGQMFDAAQVVSSARKQRITRAETTCTYCGVGCRFQLYGRDGEVLGVRPADPDETPANDFSTCVKGKFGYDYVDSDDRLEHPLIKEDGEFREASWDEALNRVAEKFTEIRDEHGEESLAVTSSSKATNEENYVAQKFARQVLHTPHVDNCTRLCHSSTVAALKQTVGYGAMTNRINEDIAKTDCYLITGSNTTESHPVLATRIVQNIRDGADAFVFDPRKTTIAEHADQYTRVKPGTDIVWLNGMMRHIIHNDLHDEAFVEERTKHFEELKETVESYTPERVAEQANVSPSELKRAAETIAEAETCIYGWAMGLTQHAHGTKNALAIANLGLLCGHLGKPRSGFSPFRGQNNVQGGGGDMGPIPNNLPGYQPVTDEEVLDKFEDAWGVRPWNKVGLRVTDMFDAVPTASKRATEQIRRNAPDESRDGDEDEDAYGGGGGEGDASDAYGGEESERGTGDKSASQGFTSDEVDLYGMYIVGENPALSEPNIRHADEALEALDFLVVQDIFLTETAELADVVLPAASAAEKYGTFTNTERRVQMVRPAVDPPGKARTDLAILQDLAARMGFEWGYDSPSDVMDEINDLVPIYGGVTHDRLEKRGDGLQWPCWDEDHEGTPYLYGDRFNFEDGLARFVPVEPAEEPEVSSERYPITLSTGRVLYHWHTGSMTRRVRASMQQVPESFVTIHPEKAAELEVEDGEYVRVESEQGEITVKVNVEETSAPDVVFIPMHFVAGAVNILTKEELDPRSRIPRYKVTDVRIHPLGPDTDAEPTTTESAADD